MIIKLHGHIGEAAATALVDGQLAPEDEERAWAHVLACAGCRRRVEQEGWIKQRLAGLGRPPVPAPAPRHLVAALGGLSAGDSADSWAHVRRLEQRANRRRAAVALVGAGSLGIAAVAMLALGGPVSEEVPGPVDPGPAQIRPDVVQAAVEGALPPGVARVASPGPVADRVAR